MKSGDIIGHEFMGEVVEVGAENKKLKVGDRVVVPFTIICGECEQCRRGNFSVCERTNRNKEVGRQGVRPHHRRAVRLHASHRRLSPAARPSTCACRTPMSAPVKIPDGLDRRAGAVSRRHLPDRLAGRGAVRHRADRHGRDLGRRAGRPVRDPQRRAARRQAGDLRSTACPSGSTWRAAGGAITINFEEESVLERLNELTARQGPGEVHRRGRAWRRTPRARSIRCTTAPSRR